MGMKAMSIIRGQSVVRAGIALAFLLLLPSCATVPNWSQSPIEQQVAILLKDLEEEQGSFDTRNRVQQEFLKIGSPWAARLPTALLGEKGAVPYKVFHPKKTQKMIYEKGNAVFELVDPDGHAYVLQAHGGEFTMESLSNMGERMKNLPDGWKYRTRTLTEELVLDLHPDQTIYGLGDEFHQYYTRIPESK